jgi:hypothetical protein
MNYTLILISICSGLLLSACSSNHQNEQRPELQVSNPKTEIFEFPIQRFSLPYDKYLNIDSNSFIYLKEAPLDTSYMVHIMVQDSKIKGVCYLVPPSYHRDLEDFSEQKHQLIFFDGFSFRLDSSQWITLKKKIIETVYQMSDSIGSKSSCFDCPSYSIIYDNKKRGTGNSKFQMEFKVFDRFIQDSILNKFIDMRKTVVRSFQ